MNFVCHLNSQPPPRQKAENDFYPNSGLFFTTQTPTLRQLGNEPTERRHLDFVSGPHWPLVGVCCTMTTTTTKQTCNMIPLGRSTFSNILRMKSETKIKLTIEEAESQTKSKQGPAMRTEPFLGVWGGGETELYPLLKMMSVVFLTQGK